MIIQAQVLNKMLANNDSSLLISNNLDDEYFSDYLDEFHFIKEHFDNYGRIPDVATFVAKFPDFDVLKVEEPNNYLIDELVKDRNTRLLATIFNKVRDLLMKNKVDEALSVYTTAQESVVKAKHFQSTDLLVDTSRYDAYVERCRDFEKYYVKTGFNELDKLIGGWDRNEELATISARPGVGKCLEKGTRVLMADGTTKPVEEVRVGDEVQGYKCVNKVIGLHNGVSNGYKIVPASGEAFTVSADHILTLYANIPHEHNKVVTWEKALVDIKIEDYMSLPPRTQEYYKIFRPAIDYTEKHLKLDPYILGSWLGDGTACRVEMTCPDAEVQNYWASFAANYGLVCSPREYVNGRLLSWEVTKGTKKGGKNPVLEIFKELELFNNKHIPHEYVISSKEQRLQLLAGLIDTDGECLWRYKDKSDVSGYSLTQKNRKLVEDIAQICRGVGLKVGKIKESYSKYNGKDYGPYYSISITGPVGIIPCKIDRKKSAVLYSRHNPAVSKFHIEPVEKIEYYGFMLDGDHRYMLWDNTLTHNTWVLLKCAVAALEQGLTVGVYSGEMSTNKVGYRFDTLSGHISNYGITRGNADLQNEYKRHIDSLRNRFSTAFKVLTPNDINGPAGVTALRAFIEQDKLDILFVDQHSLLEDDRRARNPVEKAANISRDLKNLQVMEKIPIIAVSQQNRNDTSAGVDVSHIAQSDRISQDSTIVIFLEQKDDILTLNLSKARDAVNNQKLRYASDFDRGVFSYVPEEGNALAGDGSEELAKEFEEDVL